MKRILIALAFAALVSMTGCYYYGPCRDGSGPVITETREISGFSAVVNTGSFEVNVSKSDDFLVEVEAQENLLSIIETYVSGHTLVIKTKNGTCFRSTSPVTVNVILPDLEALESTGSGKLMADVAESNVFACSNTGSGYLSVDTVYAGLMMAANTGSGTVFINESYADETELVQSGSGTLEAAVMYAPAEVTIKHSSSGRVRTSIVNGVAINAILSGSGRIDLSGELVEADYILNSSGRIDALDLMADDVGATITGSGKIYVFANQTLDATITGSGDIIYRGDPVISTRITGSGSVRPY